MPTARIHACSWRAAILLLALTSPGLALAQVATAQDFDQLSRRADAARLQGNTGEAIRDYENAVKIRPDWPEGWWYLGTLYAETGRFGEAIPAFRKLTDANPKLGPAWASLGLAEFEMKDYPDSLTHLQQAQELGFAEVPSLEKVANYHLALLLNLNGEFEDAFELVSSKFGRETMAQQTRVALAMSLLRIPLLPDQLDPSKDALIADAGEAAELLVTGNFDHAFGVFQQMLKDYPNTPFLHYAYGSALDFRSRYDEAEAQLREEIQVRPQSALTYKRLAAICLKAHRPSDALPWAQRAVELAPESSMAHKILAKALAEVGRYGEAARETAAADKLNEKPEADSDVASFYMRSALPAGILDSAAKTDETAPGGFDELAAQANAAAQAGRTEEAIGDYQSALRRRPTWGEGWESLGILFYIAGRHAEGISALKNSLGIDPQRAGAWVFLGLCEFERREYRNAYLHMEHGRELGFHGTPEAQRVASLRLAELRTWSADFDGAKDLLIPEIDRGQLASRTKMVLGLILLRLPLLPEQVQPKQETLVRAAGETAALLYAERYNEAFQAFRQMLNDFPDTPFLHYAYGSALESLSQHDEAEARLRDEIKVSPGSALPYMRLAAIALRTQRPEDAMPNAEQAAKLDPEAPGGHELLGRALLELGKIDAAIKELEIASRLAPDYPEVHFNLARAYTKARMPAEAERERATFVRLSEEREKMSQGSNQAFMTPYDRGTSSPSEVKATPPTHPQ